MGVREIKDMDEFKSVLGSSADKLVVCDFTATWCPPCQMIKPKFEAMSEEFTEVVFIKVDVDDASDVAEDQGIKAMPTFKFYKNGSKVDELTGADVEKLRAKIEQNK